MTTTEIRKIVEQEFDIDLSTVNRKRKTIRARWVYYYLCRTYTKQSLMAVGQELKSPQKPNGFDHATVLWGVQQMEQDIKFKQFEYPQEFRNILSVFVVRSGDLLENMVSDSDRISALKTDFYQRVDAMMQEFNQSLQDLRKVCADDIINQIQRDVMMMDPSKNIFIKEKDQA